MKSLMNTFRTLCAHILSYFGLFLLISLTQSHANIHVEIPENQFVVLAFHDIREDALTEIDPDPYAMNASKLAHFFDFIKSHHLNPVSLQQILDAQQGKQKLPKNAVLLTFDDGPESNFTVLFPLLKYYQYPALLALETGWITGQVPNDAFGKNGFVTWAQLREMKSSGLVEFATHTHDLHRGILANPQGNLEPAAITHLYDEKTKRYESDDAYQARIANDLKLSLQLIEKELGVQPRVVVWPYGAMNEKVREIASSVGLPISFSLGDDQANHLKDTQLPWSRLLILNSPNAVQIEQQINEALSPRLPAQRAVQISLDDVYDADPVQVDLKLGQLLDRIKALNIRSVYLKAFFDPDNKGVATQLYFPNRHLPMRADLFNRVAWQLRTRAGVQVYAWMPLYSFQLPNSELRNRLEIKSNDKINASKSSNHLNPFLPQTTQVVGDIYEDLGRNSPSLKGILINNDESFVDDEDAMNCISENSWQKAGQIVLRCQQLNPQQKAAVLIDFGDALITRLNRYRNFSSNFSIVRGIDAEALLQADSDAAFSQIFTPLVQHYDEINLNVKPYLVSNRVPTQDIQTLIRRVALVPHALDKVTFNLNAKDQQTGQWVNSAVLQNWMQTLLQSGVKNIAYSPDDFQRNQPEFATVFSGISLNQFPAFYKEPKASPVIEKKVVAP